MEKAEALLQEADLVAFQRNTGRGAASHRLDNATNSSLAALWDASRKREWGRKAHLEEARP